MVINVSKANYPQYAAVWKHPKLRVHIGDGAAFLESHKKSYDVVIVDSSDPVGPAEALFQEVRTVVLVNLSVLLFANGMHCCAGLL